MIFLAIFHSHFFFSIFKCNTIVKNTHAEIPAELWLFRVFLFSHWSFLFNSANTIFCVYNTIFWQYKLNIFFILQSRFFFKNLYIVFFFIVIALTKANWKYIVKYDTDFIYTFSMSISMNEIDNYFTKLWNIFLFKTNL